MKCLLTLFIIFSPMAFSKLEKEDFNHLINQYLDAISNQDEVKLKTILSAQYFEDLKKSKTLEKAYKQNKINRRKKRQFDLTFKKASKEKNKYFVNLKAKNSKEYDSHWYSVIEVNGKAIIDEVIFLEE